MGHRPADEKGTVADTYAVRTTILLDQDSTWLVYTTFWSRDEWRGTFTSNGGAWRRNGDTLWLAPDIEWLQMAAEYTPNHEVVIRDTLKSRPQPGTKAWKAYRATIRNKQLSVGRFGATDTIAGSDPLVCPAGAKDDFNATYDRVVCPGIYDRRTASTP